MKNVDTRSAAPSVRAAGRVGREVAAARAMLARPREEPDAVLDAVAGRLASRLAGRRRPRVHVRALGQTAGTR